jgi:Secretion system C-terminal sorting domain
MKKILLISSFAFAINANAQLTQANNAPAGGDSYSTTVISSAVAGPGASGANANWNFSTATIGTTVNPYVATTNTNTAFNPANITVSNGPADVSYYKSAATDLLYYGGNIQISFLAATITYTAPAIIAKYPMALNTASLVSIGGSISASGIPGTFNGSSSTLADGTGTLQLPSKTFTNVIRVVTTQTINFSSIAASGTLIQVYYNYFAPGKKYPVFSINTSSANVGGSPSSQTVVTIASDYLSTVTGLNNNNNVISDLNVYPNPSSNIVNFTSANELAVSVSIFDLTGRKLETTRFANGKSTMNTSNFASGVYF